MDQNKSVLPTPKKEARWVDIASAILIFIGLVLIVITWKEPRAIRYYYVTLFAAAPYLMLHGVVGVLTGHIRIALGWPTGLQWKQFTLYKYEGLKARKIGFLMIFFSIFLGVITLLNRS